MNAHKNNLRRIQQKEHTPSENQYEREVLMSNFSRYLKKHSNQPRMDLQESHLENLVISLAEQIKQRREGAVYKNVIIDESPCTNIAWVDLVNLSCNIGEAPILLRVYAYSHKANDKTRKRKHEEMCHSLRSTMGYVHERFKIHPRAMVVAEGPTGELVYQEVSYTKKPKK